MHFAFAVAHGAQAAPHLAVGSLGRSLELLVVGSETSAPASILNQWFLPALRYASSQKRVHGRRPGL